MTFQYNRDIAADVTKNEKIIASHGINETMTWEKGDIVVYGSPSWIR